MVLIAVKRHIYLTPNVQFRKLFIAVIRTTFSLSVMMFAVKSA